MINIIITFMNVNVRADIIRSSEHDYATEGDRRHRTVEKQKTCI